MSTVRLRPATETDAALVLAWRNDPETRRNSRRQYALSWEEFIAAPAGAVRATYVGECEGAPIGSVHIDRAGPHCELSWTVAPEARGRGLGKALVAAAIAEVEALGAGKPDFDIIAIIKCENLASRRIAESLGFAAEGETDGLMRWRRRAPGRG